jgi:hypothetical protein
MFGSLQGSGASFLMFVFSDQNDLDRNDFHPGHDQWFGGSKRAELVEPSGERLFGSDSVRTFAGAGDQRESGMIDQFDCNPLREVNLKVPVILFPLNNFHPSSQIDRSGCPFWAALGT